ncbi:alpha-amylase [Flavihumibacter petaseus NBRC 106054]|uniref:Alpha-amylase n=2 Tax=Flavihumibacter TaxID=1004301 RepID=A0A0E9N0D3_9BACT|nr:alpha-amylase [Flavihumibacter petaseus NBRC 106054]
MIQFFDWYIPADSTHWQRFKDLIPTLTDTGITAAWLPPAYKGTTGVESRGYDVYDIYDLGEFDQKGTVATRFGTKEQYIVAVKAAREAGLDVYVDIVLNHMGGAEETEPVRVRKMDPEDRTKAIEEERTIQAYTRFTFPGRNGKYSDFTWDKSCFTGVDLAADTREYGIFNIISEYEDWEPMASEEKGNFDFLMLNDIETRKPQVREELKRLIAWYGQTVPFNGVRLDAVKHINPGFYAEWLDHARAVISKDLFAVGEYWKTDDVNALIHYLELVGDRMMLMDAPLHESLAKASREGRDFDMRTIFDGSLVQRRPEKAVTFVDNHDTQPLQSLEDTTQDWFRLHGYALILLRKDGYPVVFYPHAFGSHYKDDKGDGEKEVVLHPVVGLDRMVGLRSTHAYGDQNDVFESQHCIGWVREGVAEMPGSGMVVVLNTDPENGRELEINLPGSLKDKVMYDGIEQCDNEVHTGDGAGVRFPVKPNGVSVWICR